VCKSHYFTYGVCDAAFIKYVLFVSKVNVFVETTASFHTERCNQRFTFHKRLPLQKHRRLTIVTPLAVTFSS